MVRSKKDEKQKKGKKLEIGFEGKIITLTFRFIITVFFSGRIVWTVHDFQNFFLNFRLQIKKSCL